MKLKILLKLSILIALAIQVSCKKQKAALVRQEPPVTLSGMIECHNMTTWDSSAIHTKLIGKWDWEYIGCYANPEGGNYKDFQGLLVEFKNDNTLEVIENGQTTQTATWELKDLNDGYFALKATPIVLQLPGRILFCDERVLFSDSFTDGCDNYFKRKN